MPARDIYHNIVKGALEKNGWTITHDPFPLQYGVRKLYADLGAEKLFAAESGGRKIVVEVKSFGKPSEVEDLQEAIGAYSMYRNVLSDTHPNWELYMAIPQDAYQGIFSEQLGQMMVEREDVRLVIFDPDEGALTRWIP